MTANTPFQEEAINAIRFLSADAVQKANSGHAGQPMGSAAIAYTLFTRHLKFNPANPNWVDRDRFILSAGHGSMLLYSLFYLTGYQEMTMDQLKNFRRPNSLTPGHPEYGHTAGVETTTGPLGQGMAVAVGMAMAEAHLAAVYNTEENHVVDHYTYVIASDGDLMEGITSEASSLAGHFSLGKLIVFYDDNRVTIDGGTDITFTEDRAKRYEAYGWQVLHVEDGNNVGEIDQAINKAKNDPRPSLIICRTILGYGFPTWGGLSEAHSGIPSDEELAGAKKALGYPTEPKFYVSDEVLAHYREALVRGKEAESKWETTFQAFTQEEPELASQFKRIMAGDFPENWQKVLPVFETSAKGLATRAASHKIINALAQIFPGLVGGSADLSGSNSTTIENTPLFQKDSYEGRYIPFGVREHAMGAINNGLNQHGGLISYAATFLIFSDYLRPALRLSALSDTGSIWVFSHDSFCLGQDGPTHQPIEHLSSLRAMPNLVTLRPADANETSFAWKIAIERRHAPTVIALTRQPVPTFDREKFAGAAGTEKGAYVMADLGPAPVQLVFMATGSELELVVKAAEILAEEGVGVRVISMPSWELFEAQPQTYQDEVMLPEVKARLAVEAATSLGWHKWVGPEGKMITLDRFGASAPNDFLFTEFGFTVENILLKARELLAK
ncbi:MAG: transketolase [Anaerolineaceae bacterium]|nr:transketolase [Anaerolineaceae bacterium]MDD4577209.1 transketolase [Anaerolineaceae bacterium]